MEWMTVLQGKEVTVCLNTKTGAVKVVNDHGGGKGDHDVTFTLSVKSDETQVDIWFERGINPCSFWHKNGLRVLQTVCQLLELQARQKGVNL